MGDFRKGIVFRKENSFVGLRGEVSQQPSAALQSP